MEYCGIARVTRVYAWTVNRSQSIDQMITALENLARIYSVEEGETITFLDLMRRGIQEKYQLGEKDNERGTIS